METSDYNPAATHAANEKLVKFIQDRENLINDQEAQLKAAAKSIQALDIPQPEECLFGCGVCWYPINDCYKCPVHGWCY